MNRSRSSIYLSRQTPLKFRKVNKLRNSLSQNHIELNQPALSLPPCTPRQQIEEHTPRLQESGLPQTVCDNDYFRQTLKQANFKHHGQGKCMCEQCNCGRHLCKLNIVRPQQHKKSSYHHDFTPKKTFKSLIMVAKETPALKSQSLVKKSFYKKQFLGQKGSTRQLQKTSDQLTNFHCGPSNRITSYSNQFYHKPGVNQYVKPTDSYSIGASPFFGKTTYAKEFGDKHIKRSKSLKVADSIKSGGAWFGQSTYNMNFHNPNPEDFEKPNLKMSRSGKILQSPELRSRFMTNYKQEFQEKQVTLCPIKKIINSGSKFNHLRKILNEQGDFRGLNPEFKAIATSKHFYV